MVMIDDRVGVFGQRQATGVHRSSRLAGTKPRRIRSPPENCGEMGGDAVCFTSVRDLAGEMTLFSCPTGIAGCYCGCDDEQTQPGTPRHAKALPLPDLPQGLKLGARICR
jgi:hypothetical protein